MILKSLLPRESNSKDNVGNGEDNKEENECKDSDKKKTSTKKTRDTQFLTEITKAAEKII
eukprot:Pgem_evm1s8515